MKGSQKIVRLCGIDVFVHWTFLLLVGWVLLAHWLAHRAWGGLLSELLFLGLVFGTVILHELGHALAARRYGIRTHDITLLPIGGVARLERMPDQPRQELVVALAGPAVNVVLAILLAVTIWLGGGWSALVGPELFSGDLLTRWLWVNVSLAVFNLLPAFPMDGGRVLRALLALAWPYATATRFAATVGQVFAIGLGLLGLLFFQPLLVLVAMFIGVGAAQENQQVQTRHALGDQPVVQAMITRFETLDPRESLRVVADRVLAGFQADFPVTERGNVVGMVTQAELLRGLALGGLDLPVSQVMRTNFFSTSLDEPLDAALARMQREAVHALPVFDQGRLVGLLTLDNLADFLALRQTLRAGQHPDLPPRDHRQWRASHVWLDRDHQGATNVWSMSTAAIRN